MQLENVAPRWYIASISPNCLETARHGGSMALLHFGDLDLVFDEEWI